MALALYRKYRPRSFAEMIGQEHVTDPLSQALRSGRLNHAYLFSGPRGCGKTSSARILARSLNCEAGPTPTPCDVCESCRGLAPDGGGSIDVIEIDAASHGGVDDARELRERAFFAPASSRFKIYIIDEAHMVSSAGFNALLKLVEEPPEYVKFVFATTEPEKVLGTIKSRTHHYPFRLIPPSVLRPYLEKLSDAEGVAVEQAVFPLVVRAGGGSVRDSLSVLDQLIAGAGDEGVTYARAVTLLGVTDVALIDEMVDGLAAGDGAAAFATIDALAEAGHDSRRFAADLLQRFRDLIILRQLPDAIEKGLLDAPEDELARMRIQAGQLGDATLSRCADIVHNGLVEMRGAASPRLLLELIVARMLLPAAEESVSALLQRVERLESGFVPATTMSPGGSAGSPTARSANSSADAPGTSARGGASGAGAGSSGGGAASDSGVFGGGASGAGGGGLGGAPGSDGFSGGSGGGASSAQAAARAAASQAASRASAGSRGKPSTPDSASAPNSQKPAANGGLADGTPGNGDGSPSNSDGSQPSAAKAPAPEQPDGSHSTPAPSAGSSSDSGAAAASRATSTSVAPRVQAAMSEEESWPVAATPGAASAAMANASPAGAGAGSGGGSGSAGTRGTGGVSAGAGGAGSAGTRGTSLGAGGAGSGGGSAGAGGVGVAAEAGAPAPRQASESGVDAATVRRHWDEIVRMLGQGSKKAAAFAREAVVREVEGNMLILVFKHKIHADGVSNDPAPLREAVRQVIGGAWELRCEIGGDQRQSARTSAPAAAQKAPPQKAAPQKAQPASSQAPADDEVPYDPEFDGGFDPGDEPDVETDSLTVRQTSEEQALESLRNSFNLEKINETGR